MKSASYRRLELRITAFTFLLVRGAKACLGSRRRRGGGESAFVRSVVVWNWGRGESDEIVMKITKCVGFRIRGFVYLT